MNKRTMFLCLLSAGMMWMPMLADAATNTRAEQAAAAPDDREISGTVEDANGPLIGASVKVVGANTGTITD